MIRRITLDIGVRPSTLSFFCVEAKLKQRSFLDSPRGHQHKFAKSG